MPGDFIQQCSVPIASPHLGGLIGTERLVVENFSPVSHLACLNLVFSAP